MCMPKAPAPYVPPPPMAAPPPLPIQQLSVAPATDVAASEAGQVRRKLKGRDSLRIDAGTAALTASGLNIPQG
jgi:hypothetical protein